MSESTRTIDDLRKRLFDAIDGVSNGTLSIEKAEAINNLAQVVVNTAKVEVAYLATTNGGESTFISSAVGSSNLPPGVTGVTRHRLLG